MGEYDRGFNAGLHAAIAVIQAGPHSAARNSGLWGIQDDEQLYIECIRKLALTPKDDAGGR
jgi:hypothetical protein